MWGLTTLRITSSPSTVVAGWIWPMEALPSGLGSMCENISSTGRPSPLATRSRYSGNGMTGSRSSRFLSSSVMNGGSRSSRSASTWPELDVGRPEELQAAAELALQAQPADVARDERAREKGRQLDEHQREALDPGELVAVAGDGDGAAEDEPARVAQRREVALDQRRRLADVHDLVAGPLGDLRAGVERRHVLGAHAPAQARHAPEVGGDGLLALGQRRRLGPPGRVGADRAGRGAGVHARRGVVAQRAGRSVVAVLGRLALGLGDVGSSSTRGSAVQSSPDASGPSNSSPPDSLGPSASGAFGAAGGGATGGEGGAWRISSPSAVIGGSASERGAPAPAPSPSKAGAGSGPPGPAASGGRTPAAVSETGTGSLSGWRSGVGMGWRVRGTDYGPNPPSTLGLVPRGRSSGCARTFRGSTPSRSTRSPTPG